MTTSTELIELSNGIRTRAEKWIFEVLDPTGRVTGEVHPVKAPQIEFDSSAAIMRRLTGFRLTASEYASINTLRDSIRPSLVLEDGSTWPMGLFLFSSAGTARFSYGLELNATLADQGLILAQAPAETLSFPAGTAATDAIRQTFEAAGIYNAQIASLGFTIGSPLGYPAGLSSVSFAKILSKLCSIAGGHPPFFANDGTATVRGATNLSTATASITYPDSSRIIARSIHESNDLLTAANRYLVIDTAATTAPVWAVYKIPADAPHSYENRGRWFTKTLEAPGVGSVEQALAYGESYYRANAAALEKVVWASPVDPRHDAFTVVSFRDVNYLETSWSVRCAPGGPMTHTGQRVYA